MTSETVAPPLRVWIISGILMVVIVLFRHTLIPWLPERLSGYQTSEEEPAVATPPADVYIFGSSSIGCAFENHQFTYPDIDETVSGDASMRLYRVAVKWCTELTLEEFTPSFSAAVAAKPKLILLDTALLVREPSLFHARMQERATMSGEKPRPRKLYTLNWILKFREPSGPTHWFPLGWKDDSKHIAPYQERLIRGDGPDMQPRWGAAEWNQYRQLVSTFRLRPIETLIPWLERFRAVQAAGTRILLIEVPRSVEADTMLPAAYVSECSQMLTRLQKEYGLDHLSFAEPLAQKTFFQDAAHVNATGAVRFQGWFFETLREQLQSAPSAGERR